MPHQITKYLKYAHLQMGAEALYGLASEPPGSKWSGSPNTTMLTSGNKRSSKFTKVNADWFADRWDVVEHISNTGTGFSGTLFKAKKSDDEYGITAGELVLSFRSTEFADDAARDNQATNTMEIKEKGWAFGQISDMQTWFESLQEAGKIDTTFTVTGYSLGGHLATAFNLLYPNKAKNTYTFNGAGVGKMLDANDLSEMMKEFRKHRATGGNSDLFKNPLVLSHYNTLKDVFAEVDNPNSNSTDNTLISEKLQAEMEILLPGFSFPPPVNAEVKMLYAAVERAQMVALEAERVNSINGIPSGVDGSKKAQPVATSKIAATALDYQLAVLRVSDKTSYVGYSGILGRTPAPTGSILGFYDIYGEAPPSAVANSQFHYGAPKPIFIEDQPLRRGGIVFDVGTEFLKKGEVKLLVENFGLNDFGDTHSLVLIVDSLSVQHALTLLQPEIDITTLNAILAAAANDKATGFIKGSVGVGENNQGKADGNTLEALVNAFARTFKMEKFTDEIEKLKGNTQGNTWAEVDDADGYTGRDSLHKALKAIMESDTFQSLKGKATITVSNNISVVDAKDNFGAFLAIYTLSPFVFNLADGEARDVLAYAHQEIFDLWQSDRDAEQNNDYTHTPHFSDTWIADRAA